MFWCYIMLVGYMTQVRCFGWMYVWYIGILYAKVFSGFSVDLSLSVQLEDVEFINSGENVGTSKLEVKN